MRVILGFVRCLNCFRSLGQRIVYSKDSWWEANVLVEDHSAAAIDSSTVSTPS